MLYYICTNHAVLCEVVTSDKSVPNVYTCNSQAIRQLYIKVVHM